MNVKNWHGRQEDLHILDRKNEGSLSALNVIHCLRRAAGVAEVNEGAVVRILDELRRVINRPYYREELASVYKHSQLAVEVWTWRL
jgi:hypothetical protein